MRGSRLSEARRHPPGNADADAWNGVAGTEVEGGVGGQGRALSLFAQQHPQILRTCAYSPAGVVQPYHGALPQGTLQLLVGGGRSEERRVGKEGRSRWSPYH